MTTDEASHVAKDSVAAGSRLEHRLNPYDAPAPRDETPYQWALEGLLVLFALALLAGTNLETLPNIPRTPNPSPNPLPFTKL